VNGDLNEAVVQRVNDLGTTPWSGRTFRYTSAGRDPLSGAGARLAGGRWNPRDIFATVYLAQPRETSLGEFDRLAASVGLDPLVMLRRPYELHTIDVTDLPLLDLRTDDALAYVGLTGDDIADDDWTACQAVGHAAYFLELGGVIAPSATGTGLVVAAFETRLAPGGLRLVETIALDAATYETARQRPEA
jgi:RES domain-containing protein